MAIVSISVFSQLIFVYNCDIALHQNHSPLASKCPKPSRMRLFAKSASIITLGSLATWSLASPLFNSLRHFSRDEGIPSGGHGHGHCGMSLAEKEQIIIGSFSNVSISEWSYYYTHGAHLGGKNYSQAEWTRDKWSENGIPSSIVSYNVFLNYPVSHALSLSYPDGSVFNATLEEDVLPEDATSGFPDRIPTFHGYSFTGKATAEYVYVGHVIPQSITTLELTPATGEGGEPILIDWWSSGSPSRARSHWQSMVVHSEVSKSRMPRISA